MRKAVVFDVGRVLFQWQLRALFETLIDDPQELDWFLDHVVTEEWHFEHDRGRALADMIPERAALFPAYAAHIRAYRDRFNETITGPVPRTHAIVSRLAAEGVPLFCLTNFGDEFWQGFRPSEPIFDHSKTSSFRALKRSPSRTRAFTKSSNSAPVAAALRCSSPMTTPPTLRPHAHADGMRTCLSMPKG